MQKKTTTVKFEIRENSQARPKLSTVSLLKQFARVYTCSQVLEPSLRNFILNLNETTKEETPNEVSSFAFLYESVAISRREDVQERSERGR